MYGIEIMNIPQIVTNQQNVSDNFVSYYELLLITSLTHTLLSLSHLSTPRTHFLHFTYRRKLYCTVKTTILADQRSFSINLNLKTNTSCELSRGFSVIE